MKKVPTPAEIQATIHVLAARVDMDGDDEETLMRWAELARTIDRMSRERAKHLRVESSRLRLLASRALVRPRGRSS